MIDAIEMGLDDVPHARAELIDQEGAAGLEHRLRRRRDLGADAGRQRREGQARNRIVRLLETEIGDDLANVDGGAIDDLEARVGNGALEIVAEIAVGIDRDQRRIGREAIEYRAREGADAGAIFDDQLGVRPIDRREHPLDQRVGRGDDRSDHHGMFQESAEEHRQWPGGTLAALHACGPIRGKTGHVVSTRGIAHPPALASPRGEGKRCSRSTPVWGRWCPLGKSRKSTRGDFVAGALRSILAA